MIAESGVRLDDPRLDSFFTKVKDFASQRGIEFDGDYTIFKEISLTKSELLHCMDGDSDFLFKTLTCDLVIPEFDIFANVIASIYDKVAKEKGGNVAAYNPQLARYNPSFWAVSICTVDGQRLSIGDLEERFCLETATTCLNYPIAINEWSTDEFHKFVGREPSGGASDDLTLNLQRKPHNPMIDAGALATISLIKNQEPMSDRFDFSNISKFHHQP